MFQEFFQLFFQQLPPSENSTLHGSNRPPGYHRNLLMRNIQWMFQGQRGPVLPGEAEDQPFNKASRLFFGLYLLDALGPKRKMVGIYRHGPSRSSPRRFKMSKGT